MTSIPERVVVTAVLTGLVGALVVLSFGLSPVARLAPLVVGVPTLCLLCLELAADVVAARTSPALSGVEGGGQALGARAMFEWLGVLVACALLAGLAVGMAFFVLAFLRFRSNESWRLTLGLSAGVWVVLHVGLEILLRMHLYDGLLPGWIE
jgi:hypothetical protein